MSLSRRAFSIALIAASVACAGRRHHASAASLPDIPLKVTNRNWHDVTIYVLHDGQRTRIGLVTGSSTQEFVLPARLLGQSHELALLGEAIGSPVFARTEVLTIQPGQFIEWTLETDLRRSSVGVY
jgi:hypothetical protein